MPFEAALSGARNKFNKLSEMDKHLGLAQGELKQLLGLGELLEPDDVIKSSAKLVAGGIGPHVIASWLADMPQAGGEPLMGWVAQHIAQLGQAQQQLAPMREQARHQMGVAALGSLANDHVGGPRFFGHGGPPQPSPAANPLTQPSAPLPMPSAPPGNTLLH